jgi:predicted acetyltransferase
LLALTRAPSESQLGKTSLFAFKNLLEYLIKYIKFRNSLVDKIQKCSAGKIGYGALATIRCRTQVMGVLRVSGDIHGCEEGFFPY